MAELMRGPVMHDGNNDSAGALDENLVAEDFDRHKFIHSAEDVHRAPSPRDFIGYRRSGRAGGLMGDDRSAGTLLIASSPDPADFDFELYYGPRRYQSAEDPSPAIWPAFPEHSVEEAKLSKGPYGDDTCSQPVPGGHKYHHTPLTSRNLRNSNLDGIPASESDESKLIRRLWNTMAVQQPELTTEDEAEISLDELEMIKRVGTLTLRVEVLSFSAKSTPSGSIIEDDGITATLSPDAVGGVGEYMDNDPASAVDEGAGKGEPSSHAAEQATGNTGQQGLSGSSTSSSSSADPPGALPHLEQNAGNNDEDEERGRRRKKRRLSNALGAPDPPLPTLRLACPYQAYEPWRRCLQQAGGCADIARLKQHMARKHMVSFRCQRCWASCDTRHKATSHPADKKCIQKHRPVDDYFMNKEHEEQVENTSRKATTETIWWAMFRLLIRGVEGVSDSVLQTSYSPYYRVGMKPVVQWMHAPITIASDVLQSIQAGSWTTNSSNSWISSNIDANTTQEVAPDALSAPPTRLPVTTQPISLPVYQLTLPSPASFSPAAATTEPSEPAPDPLLTLFDPLMIDLGPTPPMAEPPDSRTAPNQLERELSLLESSHTMAVPCPPTPAVWFGSDSSGGSSSPNPNPNPNPNPTQAERNHQRHMQRFETMRAENRRLREANAAVRSNLDDVEQILEEVCAMGNMPDDAYDRLAKAAELVMAAKKSC
ncbi:hypothetical protein QBC47DRAFT_412445 [Echria macrotheca]|uniref:Uncharacterized protein n=1 Tax=Echria macrotheca TaxID=438768 RepID=A0AAJ0BF35_9PEZI|nr:hypothetical protein QBC47DRAFT_412445 [Echria macrotheca]